MLVLGFEMKNFLCNLVIVRFYSSLEIFPVDDKLVSLDLLVRII